MEISVLIPSRQRVPGLSIVLASLQMLESGKHKVRYAIGCDEDDKATQELVIAIKTQQPHKIECRIGPRPETLGGLINEMAEHMKSDVYTALCDDILCVTYAWDDIIAQAVEKTPHGVFFWQNALPQTAHWAIVTEKWRAAAKGIFTDHYPFWYDDLCLEELWVMATDEAPIYLDLHMADKPVNTMRMRDLMFWRNFFTKTRGRRVVHGAQIAERLGLPAPRTANLFAQKWGEILGEAPPEFCTQIEQNQGDMGPPDMSYLVAKRRAEQILSAL